MKNSVKRYLIINCLNEQILFSLDLWISKYLFWFYLFFISGIYSYQWGQILSKADLHVKTII